ncbi:MAG: NAD(P)/FAD-dependent oxidoreductase [Deltaproteobacteria bacterium]|nr:NAD(P)/FAD-dependent oxidoreductase [Deltaproteobacteria bacterium]
MRAIKRAIKRQLTRRELMVASTVLAAGACATTPAAEKSKASVVVVGAGAAGLAAAHRLNKSGVRATIYEGSARVGGRVRTETGLLAPGIVTELGAEFIDSDHHALLRLCTELKLELDDVTVASEADLDDVFFFDGKRYGEDDVAAALAPLKARIDADLARVGLDVDYRNPGQGVPLDDMNLVDYFAAIGASGWFAKLLDVAFTTEFGLDLGEQSALNFLNIYKDGSMWGDSDERFKIRGGNQRVTDGLAALLPAQLELEHKLLALHPSGSGYRLSFENGGTTKDVDADVVLLTLPFSCLREVEITVPLPEVKKRSIAELGYGTNAKLMAGVQERTWRARGFSGGVLSDERFQLAWDSSRLQPGQKGALSMFTGGKAGVVVGEGTAETQVAQAWPGVVRALGDVVRTGSSARCHWPSDPWARGSYACYRPGQWTRIAGVEGEPVGRLFFAGEHCSRVYQGFINGAVETGELAADAIAKLLQT